jgi:zinc/manganese transport system substrate-binding protein
MEKIVTITKKNWIATLIAIVIIVLIGIGLLAFRQGLPRRSSAPAGVLQVVAAENFWGSLVSQIGGSHVQVLSIVSDPNADPHEYESNATDARAIATANYVIENGAGYDSWTDKLLSASNDPNRTVLNVADLLGKKEGDNPHFWYNPAYVNQVAAQMEQSLIALDPADASYYEGNYKTLQTSLAPYQDRIATLQQQFGGTKVAATEDIFAYLASAAGLDLVSPPAFTQAVAEGNDPPASSIVEFENQLKSGGVQVLVYNEQTVTPLTDSMKALAAEQNIPVVGVTETIQPPDVSFEDWMNAQLIELQNALNAKTLGQ